MPASTSDFEKCTISLDRFPKRTVTSLYETAIGTINTGYYLPLFTQFEAVKRIILSWNWAAGFCTLPWMIFRNLWGAALLYITAVTVVPLLILGLGRLVFQWIEPVELGVMLTCLTLSFVVPGLVGNTIFYRKCRRDMADVLATSATLNDACVELGLHASSRKRLIMMAGINVVLCMIALLVCAVILDKNNPPTATHVSASAHGLQSPRTSTSTMMTPALPAVSFPVAPRFLTSAAAVTSEPAAHSIPASQPIQPAAAASVPAPVPDQPAASKAVLVHPSASQQVKQTKTSKVAKAPRAGVALKLQSTSATVSVTFSPAVQSISASVPVQPIASQAIPARQPVSNMATEPKAVAASKPQRTSSTVAVTSASAVAPASASVKPASSKATPAPPSASKAAPAIEAVVASKPQDTPLLPATNTSDAQQTTLSAPSPTTLPGHYINVGLFADENNARKAYAKLQMAGLPAFIQNVRLRDQTLLRVRVGPFANRVQAQSTLAKIHVLKLDATLVKP